MSKFLNLKWLYGALSTVGITGFSTAIGVQQSNLNRKDEEIQNKDKTIQERESTIKEYEKVAKEGTTLPDGQVDRLAPEQVKDHAVTLANQMAIMRKSYKDLTDYVEKFEWFRMEECIQLKKHISSDRENIPNNMWARLYDYGKWTVAIKTNAGITYKYWSDVRNNKDDKNRLVTFEEMKKLLNCIG